MAAVTADQIGSKYDILISVRPNPDGTTTPLPCLDRLKATQQLSQVAYMHSTDPQKPFHEATEIQRKDQLTQLSSAQVIDRDFDAWPQVDQKDWSDGSGQRVFSGQGEALGTVSNRSTKYWDGYGLLWPLTDYLPQRAFLPPAFNDLGSNTQAMSNVASHNSGFFGTPGPGFAFIYLNGATPTLVVIGGFNTGGTRLVLANPNDVTTADIAAPGNNGPIVLIGAHQVLWYATFAAGNVGVIDRVVQNPVGTLVASRFASPGFLAPGHMLAAGQSGARSFLAACIQTNPGGGIPLNMNVFLYDLGTNFQNNAFTNIQLGVGRFFESMAFLQNGLAIATTDGTEGHVEFFDISTQTNATIARVRSSMGPRICELAGGLFILAANQAGVGQMTIDLYLLQGTSLQHIGPLGQGAYFKGCTVPQAIGPYACFAVQDLSNNIQIFAYDALRGRLFRAGTFSADPLSAWGATWDSFAALATVPMMNRGTHGGNPLSFAAQWGIVTNRQADVASQLQAQEMYWGIQAQGATQNIRVGQDLTSSLIDFTSSQNKLYRQVVASFTALGTNVAASVTLNVWTDKDPLDITLQSITPDFTATVAGSVPNQNIAQLKLPINKVARKVVYEIVIQPFQFVAGVFVNAPKLQSVAVQSATGWSIHFFAALSRQAKCNDGNTYCFDSQVNGVDELSAYNFLRQLWRLRGGECTITLPSGDSYNALIQLEDGTSQKPFGISAQGVQTYQEVYELKFREDV